MQKLTVAEIIKNIENGVTFEARVADNSFEIKVSRYVPYICTAIHDGSNLRPELQSKIALSEYDRWYEEDPFTGRFISSLPITLVGLDSRFEYDLNRKPEECVFDVAWGQKVWKKKLTTKEISLSKQKHANYYKVTHALVSKIEALFDGCVLYDIHSYNWQRWDRAIPLFNVGTERVNHDKYGEVVTNWLSELKKIKLTNTPNKTAENDVFYGRGYNLEYVKNNFSNTLVLATEVSKVYCNELTGESFPKIVKELQQGLKKAILQHAQTFSNTQTSWGFKSPGKLLENKIEPSVKKADSQLFKLTRNFELLANVSPVNGAKEQSRFLKSKFTVEPTFRYNPIKINPFVYKQEFSKIRTQDISDVSIRHLYESVIGSYFDKIDLLASIDTKTFLYNSLRYFGRPSKQDIENANYLMHLPSIPNEPKNVPLITPERAKEYFLEGLENYGLNCKVEISKKMVAKVIVLNSKKTLRINASAKFTRTEINALLEHEIGVHLVTTMNSANQSLKVFNLGLPVNTKTQEGLAILSEYLSGNLTLHRLKKLALRVLVTDMMCDGAEFTECFKRVHEDFNYTAEDAFSLVTRVFRGGGFTKDYLYLSGFVEILRFWENDNDLTPLLIGKTSVSFYNTVSEMIDRKMIDVPKYVTHSFANPNLKEDNQIYEYILSGLK